MSFPKDFVWGAAAASYQIEGAASEDGRGLSVWDMMCRWPDKVWSGNTGDVGCNHYHRYEADARMMGEIGLQAYRLSISWSRVLPEGIGAVNEKGLEFYDRLIDALLENGVDPWVTLFHWDYPYALYCKGGWLHPESPDWFAEYAGVIVDKLSDRVTHWMTQNEPQCYLGLGHVTGEHAPGLKLGQADFLLATHHSHLAHGKAVQVIRARAKATPCVGAAPVGVIRSPLHDTKENIEAARKVTFSVSANDFWNNTWYADPMVLGQYPEDGLELFKEDMPEIKNGDMETICQPLDFYGANIYHSRPVGVGADGDVFDPPVPDGPALTMMDWPVSPEGLYWGPRFLYERYRLPIVVTENGMANADWIHVDGKVHDPQRIDYATRYLREYHRAISEGVPAQGYFHWSLMDNFEWALGYKKRFGVVFVDYETGERTLKDSAHWYREVIKSHGGSLLA
jgi:beta-glucosidase